MMCNVEIIVQLLVTGVWVNSKESITDVAPLSQIKVLHIETREIGLESKYNIGKKKEVRTQC